MVFALADHCTIALCIILLPSSTLLLWNWHFGWPASSCLTMDTNLYYGLYHDRCVYRYCRLHFYYGNVKNLSKYFPRSILHAFATVMCAILKYSYHFVYTLIKIYCIWLFRHAHCATIIINYFLNKPVIFFIDQLNYIFTVYV